jgi:hypothetical protein
MLDQPATSQALWSIYDQTGIRPEYLLPVLAYESGLDPSIQNLAGYPYYGINQASTTLISAYAKTDPQTYLTWPASRQLSTVVSPMLQGIVARYGRLNSGTRVYQANFYPASLATATSWNSAIVCSPSAAYTANVGLDYKRTGCIRVSDLGHAVSKTASWSSVQQAIATAYQLRPAETPRDPVKGTDFSGISSKTALAVGGILVGGGLLAWTLWKGR